MQTQETRRLVPIEDTLRDLGGIGRTTVYKLIAEGHLQLAKIGRRSFVTGESLDAYIDAITEG